MAIPSNNDTGVPYGAAHFATTHWTLVLTAQRPDSSRAFDALSQLCQTYWYPLYAYVRRRGYDTHDAQDLTQEFFARLLKKDFLGSVGREKGKFRSFLLASMNHFLANLTEGAVKVAVHRLRKRYGEILRAEIAQAVSSPEDVEDEIRHLFQILGK